MWGGVWFLPLWAWASGFCEFKGQEDGVVFYHFGIQKVQLQPPFDASSGSLKPRKEKRTKHSLILNVPSSTPSSLYLCLCPYSSPFLSFLNIRFLFCCSCRGNPFVKRCCSFTILLVLFRLWTLYDVLSKPKTCFSTSARKSGLSTFYQIWNLLNPLTTP